MLSISVGKIIISKKKREKFSMEGSRNNDVDKLDELMLPGFRFHPTDEELVGFYLKRKIQQRRLTIELIKQLDLYKYDPWDLPKLATTGEKEWYFYCPRDRKYRNSARPNRVTGSGFWKATGTDRPIYSSEGNKCIGLKKSLVFYKGKAAKGIKTDWMMHEFRLPSVSDHSALGRRVIDDKIIPPNDSWAICRIFKKTNSTAQRAVSRSWISSLPEPTVSDNTLTKDSHANQLSSQNMSLITETSSSIQQNYHNQIQQSSSATALFPLDFFFDKPLNPIPKIASKIPISNGDLTSNFSFSPLETIAPAKCTVDVSSMLLNMSSSILGDFGGSQDYCRTGFSLLSNLQVNVGNGDQNSSVKNTNVTHIDDQWGSDRSVAYPFGLPMSMGDAWKQKLLWDSSSQCPSDQTSKTFSTTKCYT